MKFPESMVHQPVDISHHGNHASTGEEWYQESALFNYTNPRSGIGGYFRIGIHPEKGTAHLYTWTQIRGQMVDQRFVEELPMPAGDVNNCTLGDVSILTIEPFKRYRIALNRRDLKLDVIWEAFTPPVPMGFNLGGATVAAGHYNCVGRASGTAEWNGEKIDIQGDGFMDHSWGVRKTHLPGSRWILAIFDPACFVMAIPVLTDSGRFMAGYAAFDGRLVRLANDYSIDMTMRDDWITPAACDARLFDEEGRGIRIVGRAVGPGSSQPYIHGKAYTHVMAEFEFGGRVGRGILESSVPEKLSPALAQAYGLSPEGIWM